MRGYRIARATWAKYSLLFFVGAIVACASLNTFAAPAAHAAPAANQARVNACKGAFFGLVPWYQYIGDKLKGGRGPDKCDIKCFNITDQGANPESPCGDGKSDIPLVLLAIVDNLLRIAALVTIGYVLYGAFQYVGSQGDPQAAARAKDTIINSLVGLALAMTAVAIVSFLGKRLGG